MAGPLPLDLGALAVALQLPAFDAHLIAFDLASKIGERLAFVEAHRLSGAIAHEIDLWRQALIAEGTLEMPLVNDCTPYAL